MEGECLYNSQDANIVLDENSSFLIMQRNKIYFQGRGKEPSIILSFDNENKLKQLTRFAKN